MSDQIICPNCGTLNPPLSIHCKKCQFNMRDVKSAEQTLLVPEETQDIPMQSPTRRAYFPKNKRLQFYVEQAEKNLDISFENDNHMILGRGAPESHVMRIDLAPYGAASYGVSRRHVRLIRMPAILIVEDLGTLNGTYINGEKLSSGHAYVLCHGDTLRLGGLSLRISFVEAENKP